MRIAALTALGLVCALSGQYIAFALNTRVRLLEKIQLMLTTAENSLNFLQSPCEKLIKDLSENTELNELKFIGNCFLKMQNGSDFPNAWRASLNEKRCVRFLKDGDKAVLVSFGEMFGTTDVAGQISNCRIHSELIKDRLEEARAVRERYASLSCGMGIVCGIGVIIMMI